MKPKPPNRALRFLRWFCREDHLEEIEGDLTEIFEMQSEESPKKARRRFTWNVIRYFRPEFIKSLKSYYRPNYMAMFSHTFLITIRTYMRYKMSFFINLIGLSTGLACTLMIYLWVTDELSIDKFHDNDSRLFQVMERRQLTDEIKVTPATPGILGEALMEEIPEIKYAANTSWIGKHTLSTEDHTIKTDGFNVPDNFFKMFSYRLIKGDLDLALKDKNSIVISESLALSLFGNVKSVIGKEVIFEHSKSFFVSGVFENVAKNSSYRFDFVTSYENFKDTNEWALHWYNNGPPTYVLLREGSDHHKVSDKISDFIAQRVKGSNISLFLAPYSDRYLYGNYLNGVQHGGRVEYVRLFSVIAIFILLIACINFMNLSTARASRRSKEVGIKKAIGAQKSSLISQFILESTLITFISLILAFLLVVSFLPEFNHITNKQITLSFTPDFFFPIIGIAVITGLISGSYPAFYLSGFKAIAVLKGEIRGSLGELWARKGLVVFQFAISVILIVCVVVVYKQINYVQNTNLGYKQDNLIRFSLEGRVEKNRETFLEELRRIPGVSSVSSVDHGLIRKNNNTEGIEWQGKNPNDLITFENVGVDYDLLETLGVEIVQGRAFAREFSMDSNKIIFNEAAIKAMNLENPIGAHVKLWDTFDLEIIGVVKDFHFQSLYNEVKPLFFWLRPANTWNVVLRLDGGKEKETIDRLNTFYSKYNPGFIFDFHFIDDEYDALYASEQRVATLSSYFSAIAVLISCLGLFGLAAFTIERRHKEIGIRKLLGSNDMQIIRLLSTEFNRVIISAIGIAIPISYLIVNGWIEKFAYKIHLEWWLFAGVAFLTFLLVTFTIGLQALKAARKNPISCLRDE